MEGYSVTNCTFDSCGDTGTSAILDGSSKVATITDNTADELGLIPSIANAIIVNPISDSRVKISDNNIGITYNDKNAIGIASVPISANSSVHLEETSFPNTGIHTVQRSYSTTISPTSTTKLLEKQVYLKT